MREYSQKRETDVTLVAFPVCGYYKARVASTALQAQNTVGVGETSGQLPGEGPGVGMGPRVSLRR